MEILGRNPIEIPEDIRERVCMDAVAYQSTIIKAAANPAKQEAADPKEVLRKIREHQKSKKS